MAFNRIAGAAGILGVGVYVALRLREGPLESVSNKGEFFASIANSVVAGLGETGAAIAVLVLAAVLAFRILFGGNGESPFSSVRHEEAYETHRRQGLEKPEAHKSAQGRPIEIPGSLTDRDLIIVGETAFDPANELRTSVSKVIYGGGPGDATYGISLYSNPGLTKDNLRTIDPRLRIPSYRGVFDGQTKLLKVTIYPRAVEETLGLFIRDAMAGRDISDFNVIFENPVDCPEDLFRYALEVSLQLFPILLSKEPQTNFDLWAPERLFDRLGLSMTEKRLHAFDCSYGLFASGATQ